jgi:hypothetical protein
MIFLALFAWLSPRKEFGRGVGAVVCVAYVGYVGYVGYVAASLLGLQRDASRADFRNVGLFRLSGLISREAPTSPPRLGGSFEPDHPERKNPPDATWSHPADDEVEESTEVGR